MSFLLPDDTLEAALAFVDGFDECAVDDGLGLASAISCGSPLSPPCSPADGSASESTRAAEHSDAAPTATKPKRSNAPAAMRLRRKRKAERLLLREQAVELEAALQQLRRARGSSWTEPAWTSLRHNERLRSGPVGEDESLRWAHVAAQIRSEREQAEMENAQLRDILAKQMKLARTLDGLLRKRGVFQGIDLVFRQPRPTRPSTSFADFNGDAMLQDVEQRIRTMYSGIGSMFSATVEDGAAVHFSMKQRPGSGDAFMEATSTTPLACSYEDALGIILGGMKLKESLANKQLIHRRSDDDKFSEKTFMVMLHDQHHNVNLRGVYLMRKFSCNDHVAYVCSSIVRPALESDLQFRECGWIMLTRSPTDPARASTFRTCYHVFPERRRPPHDKSPAFQYLGHLERFVLNSYARSTRTLLQRVQDGLLDELERRTHVTGTV